MKLFKKTLPMAAMLFAALLCAMPLSAQTSRSIDVSGTVVDEVGVPVIGAIVMVQNTSNAATTDNNGQYVLKNVPTDATLFASLIGYKELTVPVNGKAKIDLTLKEETLRLDEVLVVGYNTVKRTQVTGAIQAVQSEKLVNETSPTLEQRLQGKVAGLFIAGSSGQPGDESFNVTIRGNGSINSSNTPLYIMDGNMVPASQFATLNAEDIEDIQVLKDASATAIYGSRGANGVIVITTKRGKDGKATVSYNFKIGVEKERDSRIPMMNTEEWLEYERICMEQNPTSTLFPMIQWLRIEKAINDGTASAADRAKWEASGRDILSTARATDTDWLDLMTQTGYTQEHTVSVNGGNSSTRFFVSGGYMDEKGILIGSTFKRYSARINVSHKLNKIFSLGMNSSIGYSRQHSKADSGSRNSYQNAWFTTLLAYPYYDATWTSKDNPTWLLQYRDNNNNTLRLVGSAYVQAQITPAFTFKSNLGLNTNIINGFTTIHKDHPTQSATGGTMTQSYSNLFSYTWTNTLNYMKNFKNVHDVSGVIGFEMYNTQSYNFSQTGYDIDPLLMTTPAGIGDTTGTSNNKPNISGSKDMNRLLSYFTQWNYGYKNKYMGSASIRYDESSKFQGKNKGAVFWSVGFAWNLHNEDFLRSNENIDQLKFRTSYGTTGNQDGISSFVTFATWGKNSYDGKSGYTMSALGNPDLRWESSAQFSAGVDFAMYNGRFKTSLEYYRKDTQDLIMSKSISRTTGFSSISTNAGSIRNSGVELTVEGSPVKTKNFTWTIGGNIAYNHNQVTDLGTWANEDGYYRSGSTWYEEGLPLGTWARRKFAGIEPQTGQVMYYRADGSTTTNSGEAAYFHEWGSYNPPFYGGWNTSIRYKNLTLAANFNFAFGHYIYDANTGYHNNLKFNGNKPKYILEGLWRAPGDTGCIYPSTNASNQNSGLDYQLEKGDYMRLKLLKLSYSLNRHALEALKVFSGVDFFVQTENIWTITKFSGNDPEVRGSSNNLAYPKPYTVTGGVNVRF
ncbi:MAG: SusC/RagA family TonB-linked outer membrane protein [Prevotella sp.]|nr:SusC/RagA family TonB-linked outer membrane protein [Candidatus Equicola stercoris]